MRCGHCGASVGEGDRFCGDCGANVGGCPSCGEPLIPGKRFCRSCGLASPGTPAPSAAERRVCSVLFCDVVGFTPLSEARDPEVVRELLSRYFEVAETVIGRYGGLVEKFIGDAVMAVWGTPIASEEDAERAVRAGLDLVTAVRMLGHEAGVPGLAARAGVVTGEVAVTLSAANQGMVAGDAVNTAARVQSAAEPGSVLVDVSTQRLTGSAIAFADAGEHTLKGKAEPQRLWRAVRVLSAVGGVQRVDGLEAPLTGRDAELRTIKDLFHAAAERRVPRLVLVSGPAGVGKSRLGWEFEKYADGLAGSVWWHRGRCLAYGEGVAFWALAEIVRQRLGIAEEDRAEVAAGKLAAGLDRFVPDPAERAYAGPRLGRLLGVAAAGDSGAALSREELFAGWRLFFERLAAESPVILLVEDAQYADVGLLDFLDHLIDWAKDLPVYVLAFARPELGRARPGFGTGRNRSTLTLDPLDPVSMDQLVDALVPGMPAAARSAVTSQAQGIPLFAVETVRALIDRDIVRPVEGVYQLTGDVGQLAVPDSLHALLAARLDALDPAVRRLVTDAAVLGASFPAEALIAVSGRDEPAVRAALADLVRREVLHAGRAHDYHLDRGQARAAARTQATVGQALRLWGRPAEAHEQLAAAVQVLRADPDADTVHALGELATLGVHSGSPDADRLSAEALILGQALGVGRDQLSTSFVTRGIYLISVERRPESVAYLHEAARLATQTGDNAQLGRALINLSDALAVTDPQAAAEAARTAAGHLRRVGARSALTFAITNLVQALLMAGDWEGADRALSQAVDSDGLALIEHIACYRGWLAALRGDVASAETMLAGLRDLRGNEDVQTRAEISLAEAFIAAAHRQPDEALRHARDVVALRDALGISHECVRWAWPLAARSAHELGDVAATGELLALLDSYQPGYLAPVLQAERDLTRARLVDRAGGPPEAFAAAIANLRQQSTPYHVAHGLLDHAEQLIGRGDAEGAAAAVEEARGIGTGLRCEPLVSRADAIEHAKPRIPA